MADELNIYAFRFAEEGYHWRPIFIVAISKDAALAKADEQYTAKLALMGEVKLIEPVLPPLPLQYTDVTLQDFNSLIKTRGTNGIVIESELMRKVMALAPILAKAYETIQNRPVGIRAMPKMPPLPKPQIGDY